MKSGSLMEMAAHLVSSRHSHLLSSKISIDLHLQLSVSNLHQSARNIASQHRCLPPGALRSHLGGGEGWHLCILPLLVSRAVLGPVSTFTALVAQQFTLSAVLCKVTFYVIPITGHIGASAAPGTTMK